MYTLFGKHRNLTAYVGYPWNLLCVFCWQLLCSAFAVWWFMDRCYNQRRTGFACSGLIYSFGLLSYIRPRFWNFFLRYRRRFSSVVACLLLLYQRCRVSHVDSAPGICNDNGSGQYIYLSDHQTVQLLTLSFCRWNCRHATWLRVLSALCMPFSMRSCSLMDSKWAAECIQASLERTTAPLMTPSAA